MGTIISPEKNPPLVSVITIFFNAEKFIAEAIDSVLAQTYKHWELLLVDDGSTDGSTAIAKEYARQHPQKIRYLTHEGNRNRGKSSSRNLGFHMARGDYLTLLDADDVFLPEKLERQAVLLAANPEAGMVYGRTEYWYSWAGNSADKKRDYAGKLGLRPNQIYQPPELAVRYLNDGGMVPCICSILIRRNLLDAIGGFDESIQHLYEDQVFLFKICLAAPVYAEENVGEKYRQHSESSSAIAIKAQDYHPILPNPSRLLFLRWLSDYINAKRIDNQEIARALRRELRVFKYPRLYTFILPLKNFFRYLIGYWEFIAGQHR